MVSDGGLWVGPMGVLDEAGGKGWLQGMSQNTQRRQD